MGPTGNSRVLQIHPTRHCNLRCLHCYSSSGPEEREELEVSLLRDVVTDASHEGYSVLGMSGGEPLLYRPLRSLLEHARECGLITTVTSNGMLLDARRIALLKGAVDLLAISLDGVRESHNRMRNSEHAFTVMASRLEGVRASGIPFGFIFTLTQHNVHELDWVGQFALEQGARLLQIHPLEGVGRAVQHLAGARPDSTESAFAFMEAARIQAQVGDRLHVHVDLVTRKQLRSNPARAFADEDLSFSTTHQLSELVSPLIVEPDGSVVPVRFGFPRAYALGNLHSARLSEMAPSWKRDRYTSFRNHCRAVYQELTIPEPGAFVNWYEAVAQV